MPRTESERQEIRNKKPDCWIAVRPGDTIMGALADVTEAWSDERRNLDTGKPGSFYPLLVIAAEEANDYAVPGEYKVHCFGAVLYNEIMRKQPGIGERIRITYQGVGEAKGNQNPPELYTVRAAAGSDSAKRAYAAIGGMGVGGVGARPEYAQPPAQSEQQQQLPDDDIPFF